MCQLSALLSGRTDFIQGSGSGVTRTHSVSGDIHETLDHAQDVVKVVGNPSRESRSMCSR